MNMKEHIQTALREQFDRWEELQISIARMEAGGLNREPEFPKWVAELRGDWEENADQTNEH